MGCDYLESEVDTSTLPGLVGMSEQELKSFLFSWHVNPAVVHALAWHLIYLLTLLLKIADETSLL
jgi:hypothetical protein